MNFQESLDYIEVCGKRGYVTDLTHMYKMMEALGHPEKDLRFVHVAGTNGKGSICSYLTRILQNAGHAVGLYISPGIEGMRSRIQVRGPESAEQDSAFSEISEGDFAALATQVLEVSERENIPIVEFEALTLIALLYFQQANADVVVWEVGMGGRLDATNAIPKKEVAVIANIGFDHTAFLGDTLEKIAAEKAEIIRNAKVAVCFDLPESIRSVVKEVADKYSVPVRFTDFGQLLYSGCSSSRFSYRDWVGQHLRMRGKHQSQNAATVLEVVEALRTCGWEIEDAAVSEAFQSVQTPLRLEIVQTSPTILVDGAHNPQAVGALVSYFEDCNENFHYRYVFGMLEGKDYGSAIRLTMPYAKEYHIVPICSPRALDTAVLAEEVERQGGIAIVHESVELAMQTLNEEKDGVPVCAFGSFHVAQDVKHWAIQQRDRKDH